MLAQSAWKSQVQLTRSHQILWEGQSGTLPLIQAQVEELSQSNTTSTTDPNPHRTQPTKSCWEGCPRWSPVTILPDSTGSKCWPKTGSVQLQKEDWDMQVNWATTLWLARQRHENQARLWKVQAWLGLPSPGAQFQTCGTWEQPRPRSGISTSWLTTQNTVRYQGTVTATNCRRRLRHPPRALACPNPGSDQDPLHQQDTKLPPSSTDFRTLL